MCTLLTVSRELWAFDIERQIKDDARGNPHGAALAMLTDEGLTIVRSMEIEPIVVLLKNLAWRRFWLHQRFATQGLPSIDNCHGWSAGGHVVMHNGILQHEDAKKHAVDSMAIVQWITDHGIDHAVDLIGAESFANVFLVDEYGDYIVSRSLGGSLYTDGDGNFSTHAVGPMVLDAPEGPHYCSADDDHYEYEEPDADYWRSYEPVKIFKRG